MQPFHRSRCSREHAAGTLKHAFKTRITSGGGGKNRCLAATVLVLIANRLKTISRSLAGWKFHLFPLAPSRRTRLFQSSRRAVCADPEKTVGSVSVGMLDFIPLPRNPGGLIGKGRQSVHVRKGT